MPLTRAEQETIILFNELDDEAHVYTHNERWQKHLEGLGFKPSRTNPFGGKDYTIPKYMVKLPRAKIELSEAERARRQGQGRALHARKPSEVVSANKSIDVLGTK